MVILRIKPRFVSPTVFLFHFVPRRVMSISIPNECLNFASQWTANRLFKRLESLDSNKHSFVCVYLDGWIYWLSLAQTDPAATNKRSTIDYWLLVIISHAFQSDTSIHCSRTDEKGTLLLKLVCTAVNTKSQKELMLDIRLSNNAK